MIQEVKIFTEERSDFLELDIKNFLHQYEAYDHEVKFSTVSMIANGSSTNTLYSAMIIIKDKEI